MQDLDQEITMLRHTLQSKNFLVSKQAEMLTSYKQQVKLICWYLHTISCVLVNEFFFFGHYVTRVSVNVGILRLVQQPGSYWDRFSTLPLVGLEPTEVTACD